jgi:hypothetical protein
MTTGTKEKELITVKQLADKAGISPAKLRRILRARFPRKDKGKSYGWQPDDPQIELILKAVENHKTNTTQPKAEKPKTKAVPKPKTK